MKNSEIRMIIENHWIDPVIQRVLLELLSKVEDLEDELDTMVINNSSEGIGK